MSAHPPNEPPGDRGLVDPGSADGVRADRVWKALADPTRRALLDELRAGPRTTGELVSSVPDLCRTAVMKHLDLLVDADLVVIRRQGRRRWNHLNPVPIQRVCERWVGRHIARIASAMSRLKSQVEDAATSPPDQEAPPPPPVRPNPSSPPNQGSS